MGKTIYGFIEKIYMFFVELLFKIIKKDLTDKKRQTFKEFLQFGLVGVSNTIISYLLYVVTLLIVSKSGVKFDYIIANIVSWLLSVLWSFYWNNKFVFKKEEGEKRNIWAALFKTYVSYGFTGLILNNILSVLWVSVLHISKMLAPIINLVISIPINFFMNKLWAFGKK
uniref:GtrA family protein n=1 Tax=[Lactobacillus] rogosae TaxID=706562 RepID=UPI003FF07EC0